jgi:hypothetical protein
MRGYWVSFFFLFILFTYLVVERVRELKVTFPVAMGTQLFHDRVHNGRTRELGVSVTILVFIVVHPVEPALPHRQIARPTHHHKPLVHFSLSLSVYLESCSLCNSLGFI